MQHFCIKPFFHLNDHKYKVYNHKINSALLFTYLLIIIHIGRITPSLKSYISDKVKETIYTSDY
jgi:uncharacterized membrane protein